MKTLIHIGLIAILGLSTLNAEQIELTEKQRMKKVNYAQKIFRNKLQRKCGFTAAYWAQQHTEDEWQAFQENGLFKDELGKMCPTGVTVVKEEWMEPLYLFATKYAKDSGVRPRC